MAPMAAAAAQVLKDAVAQTSTGSIWDTSHPFAAALCKPWFLWTIAAITASITANLHLSLGLILRDGRTPGRHLRLVVPPLPGGGVGGGAPVALDFGPMLDGCTDPLGAPARASLLANGSSLSASYAGRFEMNGWWYQPAEAVAASVRSGAAVPATARIRVEVSEDGATWAAVGAAAHTWTWSGAAALHDHDGPTGSGAPCGDGGRLRCFDMRPPLALSAARLGTVLCFFALLVALMAAARTRRQMWGRWVCAAAWVAVLAIDATAAAAHLAAGRRSLAAVTAAFAAFDGAFAGAFAAAEQRVRFWCGANGALAFLAVAAHYIHLGRPDLILGSSGGVLNRGLWEGAGLFFVYAASFIQRVRSRRRADEIVTRDRATYGACWARVLAADRRPAIDGGGALAALGKLARTLTPIPCLASGRPPPIVRQCLPAAKVVAAGPREWGHAGGVVGLSRTRSDGSLATGGGAPHPPGGLPWAAEQLFRFPSDRSVGAGASGPAAAGTLVVDMDQLFAQVWWRPAAVPTPISLSWDSAAADCCAPDLAFDPARGEHLEAPSAPASARNNRRLPATLMRGHRC
jgi:hypothetical protein